MLKRLRAYLFGGPVYWCRYRHHWVRQPLPWPKPTHFSHWFCHACFHRWFEDIP